MLRTVTRLGIDGYAKALRIPAGLVLRVTGGSAADTRLKLDRAEARFRSVAARLLGDSTLGEDAARRDYATDRRTEAERLRAQAERAAERGEEREAQGREQADRRRRQAQEATARRKEAAAKRERRERLDAVEAKAEALEEREGALTSQEEAERLGSAAAAAKAERKDGDG